MSILGDLFGFTSGSRQATTTSTPQVPPDVEAARRDLLARAQAFAAEPFPRYVMRRSELGSLPGVMPVNRGPGSGGAPMIPSDRAVGGDTFKADLGFPDVPFGRSVGVPGTPTYRELPMASPGGKIETPQGPLGRSVGVPGTSTYRELSGMPQPEPVRMTEAPGTSADELVSIPRVAGFTPDQLAAFEATRNIVGSSGALASLTPTLTLGGVASSLDLAQRLPDVNIQEYMSPYTQAVLDPAIRDIEERAARRRLELGQQAARTGSFGGSRQAIAESELERGTQRTIGEESARLRQQAYNQALQQFREDQQRIPQLYSGALGQLGTGLAQTGGRLATEAQPLLNIGGMQQALGQQNLNVLRQAFEEERDYPLRGIEVLRGALGLTPQSLGIGSVGTSVAPSPNVLGSVLGGIAQAPQVIQGAQSLGNFFSGLFR